MVSLLLTVILLCSASSSLADYSNDSSSTTGSNDGHTSSEESIDDSGMSGNSSEFVERSLGTIMYFGKGIVKQTVKQGMAVGTEILTSKHDHADGKVNVPAKTLAGAIAGKATGGIIGTIPIVPNRIQGGASHVAQIVGDQAMIGIADVIGNYTLRDVMELASKGLKSLGLPPLIPTSGKKSEDENQPRRNNVVSGMSNEPVPLKIENEKNIPSKVPSFVPPPPLTFQYKAPSESMFNPTITSPGRNAFPNNLNPSNSKYNPPSEGMFNPTIMSPGRNAFPNNLSPSNSNSPVYNVYQLPQQIGTFNMYNNIAHRSGGDNLEMTEESNTTLTTKAATSSITSQQN